MRFLRVDWAVDIIPKFVDWSSDDNRDRHDLVKWGKPRKCGKSFVMPIRHALAQPLHLVRSINGRFTNLLFLQVRQQFIQLINQRQQQI